MIQKAALSLLFALSIAGLAYSVLSSLASGFRSYSSAYSEDKARGFEDVFLFIPARRIAEVGVSLAAVGFFGGFLLAGSFVSLRGIVLGCCMGGFLAVMGFHTPGHVLALLKRRRLRKFNDQLVDTLLTMSNGLKAGFSLPQVFEAVVNEDERPISQEFSVFLQQTRVGVGFSEALHNLEVRVGSEDFSLVVGAIEAARKTGGNLTEIFERIASTIRERMRIEGRVRTLTAQGRFQGVIVGAMPLLIAAALTVLDPAMMRTFARSSFGIVLIIAAAGLVGVGGLLIRKIVNIDI